MPTFATTPSKTDRHRRLVALVDRLDRGLGESIDGQWSRVDEEERAIRRLKADPVLCDIEVVDGYVSREDADRIAAECGRFINFVGPDEGSSPGYDKEMDYRIAQCRIECGLGIYTDEDDERELAAYRARGIAARRVRETYGPETFEEYEERQRRWREAFMARMFGVMRRSVQ